MNCKDMATPMALNLKLLSDTSSETVDATIYCQMFFPLMFLTYPKHDHLVAQNVVRYLKGIVEHDMNKKTNLHGYVDFDWEGSSIDRKSTSRCFYSMRSGVISWFSQKESCMALRIAKRGAMKLHFLIQIKISQNREFQNNWLDMLSEHKILVKLVGCLDVNSPAVCPQM